MEKSSPRILARTINYTEYLILANTVLHVTVNVEDNSVSAFATSESKLYIHSITLLVDVTMYSPYRYHRFDLEHDCHRVVMYQTVPLHW